MKSADRARVARAKFSFLSRLMADPDLSASSKCVAYALLFRFHNNKTGRCNPSLSAIATAIGRKRRAIFPAIAELQNGGWLTCESIKGGKPTNTNRYRFSFEPVSSTTPLPVQSTALVQQNAGGMSYTAHEPERTSGALTGASVGENASLWRAPDGAPLQENFATLCEIWRKPHGINKRDALRAFVAACAEHDPAAIIASAETWVAAIAPRGLKYLPKLDAWLNDGAWQNYPPNPAGHGEQRGGKENAVDVMLANGGHRRLG
jgi:Helix-turn-helix domain